VKPTGGRALLVERTGKKANAGQLSKKKIPIRREEATSKYSLLGRRRKLSLLKGGKERATGVALPEYRRFTVLHWKIWGGYHSQRGKWGRPVTRKLLPFAITKEHFFAERCIRLYWREGSPTRAKILNNTRTDGEVLEKKSAKGLL